MNWSETKLIQTAQAFDRKAERARGRSGHPMERAGKYTQHSARRLAFTARKYARRKDD